MTEIRFNFGENWRSFLDALDDDRIGAAEASLVASVRVEGLRARSFLDAGLGSGLFNLAAVRLGAVPVLSFDYDPASVACAETLLERSDISAATLEIRRGSALDESFVVALGLFDFSIRRRCCIKPVRFGRQWTWPRERSGRGGGSSWRSPVTKALRAGSGG